MFAGRLHWSGLAVDRDGQRRADLAHPGVGEAAESFDEHGGAWSRLTTDRWGTGSSPGSSTTSLASERIVVVRGAKRGQVPPCIRLVERVPVIGGVAEVELGGTVPGEKGLERFVDERRIGRPGAKPPCTLQ